MPAHQSAGSSPPLGLVRTGFTFSEVNRYTIEIDQRGQLWRTDATPSPDFSLTLAGPTAGEVIDGEGSTVAVGISVSGSLEDDVRQDLEHRREKVASLLLVRPNREMGTIVSGRRRRGRPGYLRKIGPARLRQALACDSASPLLLRAARGGLLHRPSTQCGL